MDPVSLLLGEHLIQRLFLIESGDVSYRFDDRTKQRLVMVEFVCWQTKQVVMGPGAYPYTLVQGFKTAAACCLSFQRAGLWL